MDENKPVVGNDDRAKLTSYRPDAWDKTTF